MSTRIPRDHTPSKATTVAVRRSAKGALPVGKPPDGEERPPLRSVTFKVDDQAEEALDALVEALDPAIRARRSVAIRGALLDAHKALKKSLQPKEARP